MKGNELFKVAVRSMAEVSREVLEEAGRRLKTLSCSSLTRRISELPMRWLVSWMLTVRVVYSNISMHGNTSSASIPIALDECVEAGRSSEGDLVLLASFGGGVTWGGVLMRW